MIRSVARRGNDSRGSGTRAKRKMVEPLVLVVVLRGSFAAVPEEECRAHSFLFGGVGGVGISLPLHDVTRQKQMRRKRRRRRKRLVDENVFFFACASRKTRRRRRRRGRGFSATTQRRVARFASESFFTTEREPSSSSFVTFFLLFVSRGVGVNFFALVLNAFFERRKSVT